MTVKLNKLLKEVRVSYATNLARRISDELKEKASNDKYIVPVQEEIHSLYEQMGQYSNKNRIKSKRKELDEARSDAFRSILYLNKGYMHHPDNDISEAAGKLQKLLDHFGFDMTRTNYSAQSTNTEVVIKSLKEPANTTLVDQLPGMTTLIEQLQQKQDLFSDGTTQWIRTKGEQRNKPKPCDLKLELVRLINSKLIPYLRAMMQMNPKAYIHLYNNVAILIRDANDIVKQRSKRASQNKVSE